MYIMQQAYLFSYACTTTASIRQHACFLKISFVLYVLLDFSCLQLRFGFDYFGLEGCFSSVLPPIRIINMIVIHLTNVLKTF